MQFYSTVRDFAVKGEIAAIDTLMSTFADDPIKQMGVLRPLIAENPANIYAKLRTAHFLNNMNKKECLTLYEQLEKSGKPIPDTDFWPNYVDALFRLAQPSEATLRTCWALLRAWPFNAQDKSDTTALFVHYFKLANIAHQQKLESLLKEIVSWDTETIHDAHITEALLSALRETPYAAPLRQHYPGNFPNRREAESVIAQAGQLSAMVADKLTLREEVQCTAENIIRNNLTTLLSREDVNLIPYAEQYADRFANFNHLKPTQEHIITWARILLQRHRAELLAYDAKKYGHLANNLADYFKEIDDLDLVRICGSMIEKSYSDLFE